MKKQRNVSSLVTGSKAERCVAPLIWTLWHDEKPSALSIRLLQRTKCPQNTNCWELKILGSRTHHLLSRERQGQRQADRDRETERQRDRETERQRDSVRASNAMSGQNWPAHDSLVIAEGVKW